MEAQVVLSLFCYFLALVLLFHLWKRHPRYGANPGLPLYPLLGSLPSILLNKHRYYYWATEVLTSAPSLTVRVDLGLSPAVSTANPANVQHILKTKFEQYPKGPDFYPFFADLLGNGIFNSDGPLWRLQRKVASHEFTSNSLRDFVIEVGEAEICDRLLPALHAACSDLRTVDLQALLSQCIFDMICQVTFGADPACLASSQDTRNLDDSVKDFPRAFDAATRITADRFLQPNWLWKTKRALRIGNERELRVALADVNRFAIFVIQARKKKFVLDGGVESKDLLSRFLRLSEPVDGLTNNSHENVGIADKDDKAISMSEPFLRDILLSFLLAGRDSVTAGIAFLIWLLSCHPRAEKALYAEVMDVWKVRKSDQDGSKTRSFSYDELKKMNYLHAALSESMRLYPPAPADCKYAAQDDTLPDGTRVRKGAQVTYNVFAMGRSEKLWGKDAREFKPERWLTEDGQFVPESPFKYPVFQAGPRICLGKEFAYVQMKLVVASIIREFEVQVSPQYKLQIPFGVNLSMVNGLPVIVKKRLASSA